MRPPKPSTLASVALVLAGLGLASLVGLMAIAGGVNPLVRPVSDYDETPYRVYLTLAEIALGCGGVLLAFALRGQAGASRVASIGAILLGFAAMSVVGLAVWPEDPLHIVMVRIGLVLLVLAVGLLARGGRTLPAWRSFSGFSWAIAGLAALGFIGAQQLFPWPGLIQRTFYVLVVAWFVIAARLVWRSERDADS